MRSLRCSSAPSIWAAWIAESLAATTTSVALVVRLAEVVELLLEHGDHLGVARAAGSPAKEDVVPRDRPLEVPALVLGVELAGEGVVELPHVLAVARVLVRGDPDADLLAVGHDLGEPPLAQLVVGQSLEPVVELQRVHLLLVGEAEPLD